MAVTKIKIQEHPSLLKWYPVRALDWFIWLTGIHAKKDDGSTVWHQGVVCNAMHSGKKWRSAFWLNSMHSGKKLWIREVVDISLLNPDKVAAR